MTNYFIQERPRSRLRQIPALPNPLAISQLNYSHNDIRCIPLHLTSAVHLQMLDLSHNRLAHLAHLQLLTELRFCNFSHNLLTELPPSLAQLAHLQHIDVSHNRISVVANVRVVREMVERRAAVGGGVEVCLEGNEVMRRKGCRETIRGWLQLGLGEESWESYEKGSRRGAKSLELPCGRDSQLTQRTMLLRVKEIESVQLQREHNDSKMQATCQMSPSFQPSQELTHSPLPQTHSQLLPCGSDSLPHDFSPALADLKEWFTGCLERLTELTSNFALISGSPDIASLPSPLKDSIVQQSQWAQQLAAASQQTLTLSQQGTLSQTEENRLMAEISTLNGRIRQSHRSVLKQFSDDPQLPVRYYRPWVAQFRKLKEIMAVLPQRVAAMQQAVARERQINELVSISPERPKEWEGRENKEKLAELLFSKEREEECLLLSGRASSEKQLPHKQEQQCENCLMGRWETTRQRQKIDELQEKNAQLEQQKTALSTLVAELQKFKQKYTNISCKQELIIQELGELAPSTYQLILLEQARTIEYMLQAEPTLALTRQLAIEGEKTHSTARQTNTEKDPQTRPTPAERNNHQVTAKISEFSLEDRKEDKRERNKESQTGKESLAGKDSTGSRGSYFKNKNIITTVRTGEPLTQQECLSTEENRMAEQQRLRQEVVVSQFNSQANSLNSSDQKQHRQQRQEGREGREKREKKETEQSQENDVILISEGSDKKNQSKSQTIKFPPRGHNILQYIKSEEFNRLMGEKMTTGKPNRQAREGKEDKVQPKASKDISSFRDSRERLSEWQVRTRNNSREPQSNDRKRKDSKRSMPDTKDNQPPKRSKTLQKDHSREYVSHPYLPMASVQGDRYKKYVQYHLRNNIIEILSKKSLPVEELALSKYHYLTNSQKLICKDPQSRPEVNRTVR